MEPIFSPPVSLLSPSPFFLAQFRPTIRPFSTILHKIHLKL